MTNPTDTDGVVWGAMHEFEDHREYSRDCTECNLRRATDPDEPRHGTYATLALIAEQKRANELLARQGRVKLDGRVIAQRISAAEWLTEVERMAEDGDG